MIAKLHRSDGADAKASAPTNKGGCRMATVDSTEMRLHRIVTSAVAGAETTDVREIARTVADVVPEDELRDSLAEALVDLVEIKQEALGRLAGG